MYTHITYHISYMDIYIYIYIYIIWGLIQIISSAHGYVWWIINYLRETFGAPTFFFRGVVVIAFVLLRRAQIACKRQLCEWSGRQPMVDARPCWDNSSKKEQSFIVSRLPWRCKGMQRCYVGYGFHRHLLFRHCLRATFATIPLQISKQIQTLNHACWYTIQLKRFSLHLDNFCHSFRQIKRINCLLARTQNKQLSRGLITLAAFIINSPYKDL